MTTNDFATMGAALEKIRDTLTPDDKLIDVLDRLENDHPAIVHIVTAFVAGSIAGMTQDKLQADIKMLVKMVQELKALQVSGELEKIINFCHNMEDRPWLIAILGKVI
jgi:hypothetical protein